MAAFVIAIVFVNSDSPLLYHSLTIICLYVSTIITTIFACTHTHTYIFRLLEISKVLHNLKHYVHISVISSRRDTCKYHDTKFRAEELVKVCEMIVCS